jgi:hypothetical protein
MLIRITPHSLDQVRPGSTRFCVKTLTWDMMRMLARRIAASPMQVQDWLHQGNRICTIDAMYQNNSAVGTNDFKPGRPYRRKRIADTGTNWRTRHG